MATVSLRACEQYEPERLREAMEEAIRDLGGWKAFVSPGERVLLKVNLVMNKEPDLAATTHPLFVETLARLLQEQGCEVLIGDSPGGLFNQEALRRIYKGTGIQEAAERAGASLNWNTEAMEVENPKGKLLKHLTQTAMLADVDKVISVSKLKTHGMMTFTGAVKNQFGTVPGTKKAEYHFRMPQSADFADALIDICLAAHPVLCWMDGIMAMEGNGPTGGTPRKVGVLLASENPFDLDLLASHLIGLEREQVPTLEQAYRRGLGKASAAEVEKAGEDPERFVQKDFRMPDHIDLHLMRKLGPVGRTLESWLRPKVKFHHNRCVGCRACYQNCPAKAITMEGRYPAVHYHQCIRCYCCQELCPKNAITVHESKIMKLVNRL